MRDMFFQRAIFLHSGRILREDFSKLPVFRQVSPKFFEVGGGRGFHVAYSEVHKKCLSSWGWKRWSFGKVPKG